MAMSTQEAKAMLAREEAAAAASVVARDYGRPIETGVGPAQAQIDQELKTLTTMAAAAAAGQLSAQDLSAFNQIISGLSPEVRDAIFGQEMAGQYPYSRNEVARRLRMESGAALSDSEYLAATQSGLPAPVQSQNFGALAGATGAAPSSGEVNLGASQTNRGATVSNTGGALTPEEEALMTQFTNDMLAREGLVRGKRPIR